MSLQVLGPKPYFWQWDTGQKLVVDNRECGEVHFDNGTTDLAPVVQIKTAPDGKRVAEVPNILLQSAKTLKAYLFQRTENGAMTSTLYTFMVLPRPKPEGYVYTETEVLSYSSLADRIKALEQGGTVTDEQIAKAVEDYFADHPIEIPDSGGNAALSAAQIEALHGMFKVCAFTKADVSAEYGAFKTAFGIVEDEPDTPEITLTSITATYTGGSVPVGTSVNALTGITVTAHYSDGSKQTVSGYTLSGTIAEGNNTITVRFNGKTTTFAVTGIAEEEPEATLSSISATYSGGEVAVGTAVSALTGIVVTAHYSDGSTANVTGYTLSGTIAEGSNTITVTYEGKTTTFTVTGKAASTGDDTRTLLYNWDFTNSLVDSVQNKEVTLSNKDNQTENGVSLGYIIVDGVLATNRTIELDVSEANRQGTNHGRLLMVADNNNSSVGTNGFIYRSTGSWQIYNGSWSGETTATDVNAIAGSTVKLQFDESGNATAYIGDVLVATGTKAFSFNSVQRLLISSSTNGYYGAVVTALRIYEGVG